MTTTVWDMTTTVWDMVQSTSMQAPARRAPDRERLQAAVALVVSRLNPDQIVLFGSAVRDEMTDDSDVDLLAITERSASPATKRERWTAEGATGYDVDVIVMDRATAEAGRHSTTRIQGVALEEGRTIYTREGVEPVSTGPTYLWNGREMVRKTRFEPEEATRLLGHADEYRRIAREPYVTSSMKCIQLQASMEHALKALTIAQGERVKHKHTLNELWDDVENRGERIAAVRDRKALEVLTLYGGRLQYESPTRETDPDETWDSTTATGEDVLNHARRRVPKLIAETTERLQRLEEAGRP